jgi:hypothetical protein
VLAAEATTAKRKEIAAAIRGDAAMLQGDPRAEMLRLAESLVYEKDAKVADQVVQMANRYAASVKSLSGGALEQRKDEILDTLRAFKYLAKWKLVPASFEPVAVLSRIEKAQGWDKPKK